MSIWEAVIIAIGLAMDCLAVSICIGTINFSCNVKIFLKIALHFGIFQGGMTFLGWLMGSNVMNIIENFDHWIAFGLLGYVGGKLFYDGVKSEVECPINPSNEKTIIMLSIATSIDALAVGIGLGALPHTNIALDVSLIAAVSFIFSMMGMMFGIKAGTRFGNKMQMIGGICLFAIGLKILLSHMVG